MGNYSNKTIGTEQEFANFSIKIANTTVTSPDASFDIKNKHLAYIVKNKKPLVLVTADSFLRYDTLSTDNLPAIVRRLELSTLPTTIDDMAGWTERKEAISLFVKYFMQSQKITLIQNTAIPLVSDSSKAENADNLFYLYPLQDNLIFTILQESPGQTDSLYRCNNQFTLGYTLEMLQKALTTQHDPLSCDISSENLIWYQDHSSELDGKNFSSIEAFVYSLIASIFEFSARVHAKFDPVSDFSQLVLNLTSTNQNHTENKNAWGILPRSSIRHLLNDLESREKGSSEKVFQALSSRTPDCAALSFGSAQYTKENMNYLYQTLFNHFKTKLSCNDFDDSFLRAGVYNSEDTINGQFIHLMEFRRSYEFFEGANNELYPKEYFLFKFKE